VIEHYCFHKKVSEFHFVKNSLGDCCEHEKECCATDDTHSKDNCCGVESGDHQNNADTQLSNSKSCCVNKIIFTKTTTPQTRSKTIGNIISFTGCYFAISVFKNTSPIPKRLISYIEPPPKITIPIFIAIASFLL
jgi:hypothetical protein